MLTKKCGGKRVSKNDHPKQVTAQQSCSTDGSGINRAAKFGRWSYFFSGDGHVELAKPNGSN